jgi:hypothetical protein
MKGSVSGAVQRITDPGGPKAYEASVSGSGTLRLFQESSSPPPVKRFRVTASRVRRQNIVNNNGKKEAVKRKGNQKRRVLKKVAKPSSDR